MHEALAALPVPFATYVVLTQFMTKHGVRKEMVDVVDEALKNWMDALQASKAEEQASTLNGYQWRQLFLPEGAKLRTICEGVHYIAHVEGCKLVYAGRSCSPSQFVNLIHRTCRHAWKTIWVYFLTEPIGN